MGNPVDSYFDNLKNPKHRDDLLRLRDFLKTQLPEATEDLTYQMPTYSQNNQVVVSMASQRHHISLYLDVELLAAHKDKLAGLDCGKSCVRFKSLDKLPLDTISKILQATIEKQREG